MGNTGCVFLVVDVDNGCDTLGFVDVAIACWLIAVCPEE
jgi:hypothetical protein